MSGIRGNKGAAASGTAVEISLRNVGRGCHRYNQSTPQSRPSEGVDLFLVFGAGLILMANFINIGAERRHQRALDATLSDKAR